MTAVRWAVQDSKARPCRRRGKKQSSGLFFSAWLVASRNVYRDDSRFVRTRTRFFMKKGSGTFFVYRRFCDESTQSGKQAKAGYHHGDGILPFVLRDQVRFVRTWLSPNMTHWRQSLRTCVRKVGTHVRSETAKISYIGVFFWKSI